MAAGNFTLYNEAKPKLFNGTILSSHTFYCGLYQSTSNCANAALSSALLATLTNEAPASGNYSTGGVTMSTPTISGGATVTYDFTTNPSWASSTITAKYAVVYDYTAASKDLLGYVDLDSGGGSLSSTNGTFSITWNANGLFQWS